MWGPRGVRQLLTNLQSGRSPFFHFTYGFHFAVFLFLNCLNLHISFIQHSKGSLMSPQYKTCFAVSVGLQACH